MSFSRVSIIGAGPAGLGTAFFLTKENFHPVIYEASAQTGGLAGAVNLWGRSFDIGPHIFLESSQPAAVNFWKEIGGKDLQRLKLCRGMILKKKLISYPPKPLNLLRAIGFIPFCTAAASALKARFYKQEKAESAGDFFRTFYGDYFRQLVFNPYCEKYMGIPDSEVDIGFATSLTSFVKEAGKNDVQPEKKKLKTLLYHKHGTKAMWSHLERKILEKGEIHFQKKVAKIFTKYNQIDAIQFSDGSEIKPDFLISTLSLTAFLKCLDYCPKELLQEAEKLKFYNTRLVYLHLSEPSFPFQYITVFDHSFEAGRVTNFNSWQVSSERSQTSILCVEYWCAKDHVNWIMEDEEIVAKAVKEIKEMKIAGRNEILDAKVLKLENSHPVLNKEYVTALERINTYLAGFSNLALIGRHATFKWDGQADNIIAGMNIAQRIAALSVKGV